MNIDFFCNDGSPIGILPRDIYRKGVGGAELALLSLTESLAKLGHQVRIFNNPRESVEGPVEFLHQSQWDPDWADVFVLFRSPNGALYKSNADVKLFWSCDQMTVGNYRRQIFPFVDGVVCISKYHRDYFAQYYSLDPSEVTVLDLGVRVEDYEITSPPFNPTQMIFCSVPTRGLDLLAGMWSRIKERIPDASLIITGDLTLWGSPTTATYHYRMLFAHHRDVYYLGRIKRGELVKHQLSSGIMAYPCTYPELFCISAAECQVAGAIPITTAVGALATTNKWGTTLNGDPHTRPWQDMFLDLLVEYTQEDHRRGKMMKEARKLWNWKTVAGRWIELMENGGKPQ